MERHRLQNRRITEEERIAIRAAHGASQVADPGLATGSAWALAKTEAKRALAGWYSSAYYRAEKQIPQIQIEENLQHVSAIPNWCMLKNVNDGYVMLRSLWNCMPTPVILKLDHSYGGPGTLTYRELYKRLRIHLSLESKYSLRVCSDRPWYRHSTERLVIPDRTLLPAGDSNCTHLLGTTLLFYAYVHLHDRAEAGLLPQETTRKRHDRAEEQDPG
jgi:hypothetical protein